MLTHDTPEVRRLGGRFDGKPAVGANADGRLDVFVKHGAGTVSHRVQNTPSGLPEGNDWSAWENLGSGAKPCVSPGTLDCVDIINPEGAGWRARSGSMTFRRHAEASPPRHGLRSRD